MDARMDKIRAAFLDALQSGQDGVEAAVREAYRLDGVEELVMAAENSLIMYGDADDYDNAQEALRAAASRVREAMRGQE